MQLVFLSRAGGKTTLLISWLEADTNRILLVDSNSEASRLKRKYPELKTRIMAAYTWMNGKLQHLPEYKHAVVGIDNVDYVIRGLFGPVETVSMSTTSVY